MIRKKKALYCSGLISEYRKSGETLVKWGEKNDVKIHTMKYWLRKQSPVSKNPETEWVSCVVEEPASDTITLKMILLI